MCEHLDHPGAAVTAADPFHAFVHETPAQADAWLTLTHRLEQATALESRTYRLAYVAVLAALGLDDAIPLQVELARDAGAERHEVASAVLVGLPAAGDRVVRCLPVALAAFDNDAAVADEWDEALELQEATLGSGTP